MAYKKGYTPKSAEEKQKEIDDLTAKMTEKIDSYFESKENIQEHLRFMSNFYNYSSRNMALIDSQFMGAEAVGSFNFWKSKGASVNKGEKGIKILVPTPVEYFNNAMDQDGKPLWKQVKFANAKEKEKLERGEYLTKKVMFFKVGHVFEYTQTNAREKGLEVSEIFGRYHRNDTIENDKELMAALEKVAQKIGVEIADTPPTELGTAKGAFYPQLNVIGLNPRNTPSENITVLLHELAHAELHSVEKQEKRDKPLDKQEKEFQAEMVAYTVASRYGIDTERFSLSYLASWTKNAEFADKEQLLNEVRKTSIDFIDVMDQHFELQKDKQLEHELAFSKPIFLVEYGHLSQAAITSVDTKEALLEKIKDEKGYEKLATITDANELVSAFNKEMAEKYYLYEQVDNKPKMLIQWSEHDQLEKNQLMRFGEGNALIAELEQQHQVASDEIGYYKTRYHVIIPNEDGVTLINPDRLDIGDGYYDSPYQQLISEKVQVVEKENVIMAGLSKEIDNQLLTDIATNAHEKQHGELNIKEPMMLLHGYTNDFKDFGKLNNIDYDELNASEYKYTVAVPHDGELYLYSNQYTKGEYVFPLHQMEKDETFDKGIYGKLDASWNNELARQDELYINSIAKRIVQEVHKEETKNSKDFEVNR